MKDKNFKYVIDFLNKHEIFFEGIYDCSTFNKEEFHKYTRAVYELSLLDLTCEERYKIAITIWEVSFLIEGFLGSHYDPKGGFFLSNLEEGDPWKINQILHYTSNWFSYKKPMEEDHLTIDSWQG